LVNFVGSGRTAGVCAGFGDTGLQVCGCACPIDVLELVKHLAGIGQLLETCQSNAQIIEAFRCAFALWIFGVIVIKGNRRQRRLAFIQIGAAKKVLRKAGTLMLGLFG